MSFDFSQFSGGESKRPFTNLGFTAEQVEGILENQYGMSETLMQEFPDITKRNVGGVAEPLAFVKAGIIFENQLRDTTYDEIATALGCTEDTAYQYMVKYREAVMTAFSLNIVTAKETIRLANQQTARDAAKRVLDVMEAHVRPAMTKLDACAKSLEAQNAPVALPAKAQAMLEASRIEDDSVV